ncbi:unnamed protein product [Microthlaspi erraticum]|uniref:F-box domain-containing protein n=1 Tax=Microthlaspi erraticum TaxID=1685480 RepID=A0A6D2HKN6_9BRAS|nr:unnamed protein product [Microthlaspi erraticum]
MGFTEGDQRGERERFLLERWVKPPEVKEMQSSSKLEDGEIEEEIPSELCFDFSSRAQKMDRIGNLPDEILCHILSFLPTKQAALTSSLSKRWLNLWTHVPDLDIDDSIFLHPEVGKGERDEIRQSFVDFVDKVMALQGDSPIKKLSLKCITGFDPYHANRWIRNMLKRGVSDLNLYTDFFFKDIEPDYVLPDEIYISKTLVNLKIGCEICVNWWHEDMGASLPMLKSLSIESERIYCGKVEKFISSFPVLEELRMATVEWDDSDVTVSSASLRKLSIHAIGCDYDGFSNPDSISFDTPSLLYLDYSDIVADDYPLVNMKKLLEARVSLVESDARFRAQDNDLLEDDDVAVPVVKLMNGILNVEKLHLDSDTLEVLSQCCESMPVFNNLKTLCVTSEEGRGWQAMPVLLRNCPHLETLIFEGLLHHVTDKCGDACDCISREDRGRSLTSCPVKKIEIQGFRGTMKEMTMIKHFLEYFPCLKEMKIYYFEEKDPTELRNREVSNHVLEMMGLDNKIWSCNVQLLAPGELLITCLRSGLHKEVSDV